jgi:hypothetical protein
LGKKENAHIYINSFFFTDYGLARALAKLSKDRLNSVFVLVDKSSTGHGKIALQILADNGAHVKVYRGPEQNHNKYVIWSYRDESGVEKYGLYSGSANMTYMARNNVEQGVFESPSKENFDAYKEDFLTLYHDARSEKFISSVQPIPFVLETPPLTRTRPRTARSPFSTPVKKSSTVMFASEDPRIQKSIIDRVDNTIAGGEIYLFAYSYNWPALTQSLRNALKRGVSLSLIVDKTALQHTYFGIDGLIPKIKQQLDQLQHLGAHILVYCGYRKSHHQKMIGFSDSQRTIVAQGSCNFTEASEGSHNVWTWYAHNQTMFNNVKHWYQKKIVSARYTPYTTFCANVEHEAQEQRELLSLPPPKLPSKSRMLRPTQQKQQYRDTLFPAPYDAYLFD